jgi:hypothetical protein
MNSPSTNQLSDQSAKLGEDHPLTKLDPTRRRAELLICKLALQFECLSYKPSHFRPGYFDAEKLERASRHWSTGEKHCVNFILAVWSGNKCSANVKPITDWMTKPRSQGSDRVNEIEVAAFPCGDDRSPSRMARGLASLFANCQPGDQVRRPRGSIFTDQQVDSICACVVLVSIIWAIHYIVIWRS